MPPARGTDTGSLRCSFCGKTQEESGNLISSPSDYPSAYICAECIEVCMTIIEDQRADANRASGFVQPEPQHPLLSDSRASELMDCLTEWILQESLGQPAFEQLNRLRDLASRMLQERRR
jgi:ATP-dependent protease Clp ATPase subunit